MYYQRMATRDKESFLTLFREMRCTDEVCQKNLHAVGEGT